MKDCFYFPHDFNARNDPKLQKVLMELGHEGKSVYWDLIEILYEQGGYLNKTEIKLLGFSLRTDPFLIQNLIDNFDLFEQDENKFWSKSVLVRIEIREEKRNKNKENGKKGGRPPAKKENPVKVNNVELEPEFNETQKTEKKPFGFKNKTENNQRKGKERKEKESKVNNISPISPQGENGESDFFQKDFAEPEIKKHDPLTIPVEQVVKIFNEQKNLKNISGLNFTRRKKIVDRWNEKPDLEFWKKVIEKANTVKLNSGWKPDFDFIFKDDTNYLRIYEGSFDNKECDNEQNSTDFPPKKSGWTLDPDA